MSILSLQRSALLGAMASLLLLAPAGSCLEPGTAADIETAKKLSEANPANAKLRFDYGEALRKSGKVEAACQEYMHATEIDASYFIAYHQLAQCSNDHHQLDEATTRLQHLMTQKPADMMLRVALSELLESQGKYYEAARPLIHLVFTNSVPQKYIEKLNSRIRFLQAKARASHVAAKVHESGTKMEVTPLPLPDENVQRGLDQARLGRDSVSDGFGHSRMQP
ncbi:MAG: hypothetical protein K2Z81_07150 [Cyanobacteria bacterium]|nr:hypothetical protein [Cyanobacteriota bacterium]